MLTSVGSTPLTIGKGVVFRVDRDSHAISDSQHVPPKFTNWPAVATGPNHWRGATESVASSALVFRATSFEGTERATLRHSLLGLEQQNRVDFELQHLGSFSTVVTTFALHRDAADFQVTSFGEFHRAVAVELDCLGG